MNNPTSFTINLIFFFSVVIGRALYLFHIEKHLGSSKDQIIRRIKKDFFVLITLIFIFAKIAEYIFNTYNSNHKWWELIVFSVGFIGCLIIFIRTKLDKKVGEKIIEGWHKAFWMTKIYLVFLFLFGIWYLYTLVRDLFFV